VSVGLYLLVVRFIGNKLVKTSNCNCKKACVWKL